MTTRALLYGAGLGPQYWSTALIHAVYLYNQRVHSRMGVTPFEGWWGVKPNLCYLKLFGSRVCDKQTSNQHAKLDKHDFTGIFLGYTSTDQNVWYINLHTGTTKTSHHAIFDKAWYLQDSRPLAAQLLKSLDLKHEDIPVTCPPPHPVQFAPYLPIATDSVPSKMALARMTHLLL